MKTAISMVLPLRGLFLVTCCWTAFALVSNETGALPPPGNLSLVFTNNFCVNLSWSPPENLNTSICKVKYHITVTTGQDSIPCREEATYHEECPDLEKGVTYAVQTGPSMCGSRSESKEVVKSISPPTETLVKDFKCFYYMFNAMNCTWSPKDETRDLQLYYWYKEMPQPLEMCRSYLYSGNDKTGCHLHGFRKSDFDKIFILLNGTRGSSSLQNRFQVVPGHSMKPFPPNLSVREMGNMLQLSCDPPRGFNFSKPCWIYKYRYRTSRSSGWQEKVSVLGKPVDIPYAQRLQYQVQVKAISKDICGNGSSDWSEIKDFGEEQPADWSSHMALIAIPVVVTACVILFLLFFKKVRVMILPQIPDPMQLFKELINSKEEGATAGSHPAEYATMLQGKSLEKQRLYVPEEPEVCVNVRVEEPEVAADM